MFLIDSGIVSIQYIVWIMPWKCPVCSTPIQHNELEPAPRARAWYRCHICRLELILDEASGKLVVAPLKDESQDLTSDAQGRVNR